MRQSRDQKAEIRNKVGFYLIKTLLISAFCFLVSDLLLPAAPWSGILDPSRAINWSTAGIPGGIPVRTTPCATIAADACGNGSTDCTATIQNALNSCLGGEVVSLGVGTFLLDGILKIPGNVTLRGQGADQTILNSKSTTGYGAIQMGAWTVRVDMTGNVGITGGATQGSQSITVSDASGISVGKYLLITELNEFPFVNLAGDEGNCSYCDSFSDNGARSLGQVSEVTSVNGNTIGITPGLFRSMNNPLPHWSPDTPYPLNAFINPATQPTHSYQQTFNNGAPPYTCTSGASVPAFPANGASVTDGTCTWLDIGATTTTLPLADPFSATKYAGVENLQIYANHTGAGSDIVMNQCAYCWVKGVEDNYTDGDHVDVSLGYHDEIVNSYFSNAFLHTPGQYDSDIALKSNSTGVLVQNNIIERNHVSVMLEWGAAGNVIAYNYMFGNFDGGGAPYALFASLDMHGAHPEFNLMEGNIQSAYTEDSIHGSSSDNTSFRDWQKGTTKVCNPRTGRGTVTCAPMGDYYSNPGVNGWWAVHQNYAYDLGIDISCSNLVGGILGSQTMANLKIENDSTPMPQVNEAVAVCGPSPCGSGSRVDGDGAYAITLGYWQDNNGSSPYGTLTPYHTLFEHGEYTSPSGAVTWASGVPQSLPASFYLSAKPNWFGDVPFPPIGPDVSGGLADAFGHAYAIPAEVCYEQVMGGTDGTGSPLEFNADRCYGNASSPPPPQTPMTNSSSFSPRAYPNPWRSDRGYAQQITFDQLTGNTTIKIFTVSGRLIKTLGAVATATSAPGTAVWDLTNDSGDKVASGIYIYLGTNDQGQQARGRVVVIK